MKTISFRDGGVNPTPSAQNPLSRFDGAQLNDGRTTRLLAALTSAAGDHTRDKLAQQMIRNATAELFDAAARLERVGHCGQAARQLSGPPVLEGTHG